MKITRERSAELRSEILAATSAEIRRVGYASLTTAKVAADCDVTASAVTNRFRHKIDLVDALMAEVVEPELGAQLASRVGAFWAGEFPLPDFDHDHMGVVSELTLAAAHTPELRPILGRFLTHRAESSLSERELAIAAGRVRTDQDRNGQIVFMIATQIGEYLASLVTAPPTDTAQITALIRLSVLDLPLDTPLPPAGPGVTRGAIELPASEIELDEVGRSLIEAARTVFAANGYEGANLQDIARLTGRTTGAIYGRFAGKAELMRALITESVAPTSLNTLSETIENNPSPDAFEDGALISYLMRLNEPTLAEERVLRLVTRSAARREPEIAAVVEPLQDLHISMLADAFRLRQSDGRIRSDLDPDVMAWWMVSFPVGFNLLSDLFETAREIDWRSILGVTSRAIRTEPRTS